MAIFSYIFAIFILHRLQNQGVFMLEQCVSYAKIGRLVRGAHDLQCVASCHKTVMTPHAHIE